MQTLTIIDGQAVATALALAGLINRIVAMAVTPIFDARKWDKTYILYVAIGLGVLAAFAFSVNILTAPVNPYVGTVVTGVLMGGGASWIHDLTDNQPSQQPAKGG